MPRKSKDLRLQQTIKLISLYEDAGLGEDRVCRFARDMKDLLDRSKALSTGRRKFLDDVIEKGVPEPKGDVEYISKIDEAIATSEIVNSERCVLQDFRGKLNRGWTLSEKQKDWSDKLIEKAKSYRDGTFWKPDEETTERIKKAVECYVCYSGAYWHSHPGGAKAIDHARRWLRGEVQIIEEYTVQKLFKTVSGKLKEMENPKFIPGKFAYFTGMVTGLRAPCLILEGPVPTALGMAYDVLVDGEVVRTANLRKVK